MRTGLLKLDLIMLVCADLCILYILGSKRAYLVVNLRQRVRVISRRENKLTERQDKNGEYLISKSGKNYVMMILS